MNVRSSVQWIIVFFFMAAVFSFPVFAGQIIIYGGDFDLPIPSPDDPESEFDRGWMDDAVIEIGDHFTIYDLDVGITLTHTSVFDLQIFVQSPAGTLLCLNMYNLDEFFEGEDYIQTIFDDEAALPIEEGQPPFTGRFRPRSPDTLSVFDGQDTFGQWRLKVYDAYYDDTGNLESFEVMITIAEPATTALLILGVGLVTLFRPCRRR
jgi:subtilisin-like proprotein convertase family protein